MTLWRIQIRSMNAGTYEVIKVLSPARVQRRYRLIERDRAEHSRDIAIRRGVGTLQSQTAANAIRGSSTPTGIARSETVRPPIAVTVTSFLASTEQRRHDGPFGGIYPAPGAAIPSGPA